VIARRLELRLVRSLLDSLNARSVLVRRSFTTFLGEPSASVAGHEMPALLVHLGEAGLLHILPPYTGWDAAGHNDVLLAPYVAGPVTVVSDGPVAGARMEWVALVATPCGVLAHTSGALVADLQSS
jgi:hypothetical protein